MLDFKLQMLPQDSKIFRAHESTSVKNPRYSVDSNYARWRGEGGRGGRDGARLKMTYLAVDQNDEAREMADALPNARRWLLRSLLPPLVLDSPATESGVAGSPDDASAVVPRGRRNECGKYSAPNPRSDACSAPACSNSPCFAPRPNQ